MKIKSLAFLLLALMAISCRTPKENIYFSDMYNLDTVAIEAQDFIKIKPGDKLTVLVSTGKKEFDELFNATYVTKPVGAPQSVISSSITYTYPSYPYISLYTVSPQGNINLPVLGEVEVAGLTREEVAYKVANMLEREGLAQNVVVIVEFEKMTVTVIGEVASPGRYSLGRDGLSIIDAITTAGDITINGNRNNVKVIRDEDGKKRTYVLDFNSAKSTMGSPGYYLQQNDIIYVEPNEKRIRQSVESGNAIYSTSFWLSLSSLLTSIASLIINW